VNIHNFATDKSRASSNRGVYNHLKSLGLIETVKRTKIQYMQKKPHVVLINHIRWYLSPGQCIPCEAHGLKDQGIRKNVDILPELRVDRGSPNTSLVTKEFFDIMGADLSFARVRRPTDNALTERFFGTAKQEEIYMVGSYPDERSAWEEIGSYIYRYNHERPHQNLWNFTPAHIHEVNNNTLKELKQKSKLARRSYWHGVR